MRQLFWGGLTGTGNGSISLMHSLDVDGHTLRVLLSEQVWMYLVSVRYPGYQQHPIRGCSRGSEGAY